MLEIDFIDTQSNALYSFSYFHYSYTQELPTRFKKELLQAASRTSSNTNNDRIVQEGMQRVLANIGASDRVSAAEIKSIFDELGNDKGEIGSQKLMQIL
jgi:hypothetical protein